MYKKLPRLPLNNAGISPKPDLPNKGVASIATLYEYTILLREDLTVFNSNTLLHNVHPTACYFNMGAGGGEVRFCGLLSHAGVGVLGLDGGRYSCKLINGSLLNQYPLTVLRLSFSSLSPTATHAGCTENGTPKMSTCFSQPNIIQIFLYQLRTFG